MKLSATFKPPKAYKPTMADKFHGLPPSSLGLLATLLALDPAARGTAAQALQSNFFSTPPLPCDLSSLPVVYKEEVPDPAASHDRRKPKLRQRSQRRKDSDRQKAEEQQADVLKINSGSPDKQEEEKVITDSAKSGQELDSTVITAGANASSSSVQEPLENTIVNASSSTVSKRFSVSPVQVLPQEASPAAPQDQQLRRANSHPDSEDDHENQQPLLAPDDDQTDGELPGSGGVIASRSLESRLPASSMADFDAAAAALRGSGELPSKQYVLVDHV